MPFNTLTVSAAVTPSIIETCLSHYLNRAPLRHKPTAHISYHEGLRLIREFLDYSSRHRVEDLQAFTGQYVPSPAWIRTSDVEVAPQFLTRAAELLRAQLGVRGCEAVGGKEWWVWRKPDAPLRAEWIEMRKEFLARKRTGARCERVMLYLHGGAYYFGSVDEHRYQMQRHARKLRARVLSPRYRLAPQFPFPCGLMDCLATYFYLLEHFAPSEILVAGDSAGAGMVLSLLVVLRDQGCELPAGTILLSPWVDLTHSFPSVAGDGVGDYIPAQGFHHKPSMAWPPPPSSDGVGAGSNGNADSNADAVELPTKASPDPSQPPQRKDERQQHEDQTTIPRFGSPLSLTFDGKLQTLNNQIHLYTTNPLLPHPLVSPILQPSLGGLPPMLIQTGGAELLRDEQIYLAHKAANPSAYPPNESIMREFDPSRKSLERWPPTDVQIQLWEDLCHVPQTLSFTRPAKYMYRGIAQFGAWALARAKVAKGEGEEGGGTEDDVGSFISSGGEEGDSDAETESKAEEKSIAESSSLPRPATADSATKFSSSRFNPLKKKKSLPILSKPTPPAHATAVGKAGDPIPAFQNHMIRQRVTRHGIIHPLAPVADLACLALDPAAIGVPKSGPVRKWLRARETWDTRFAAEIRKVEKRRAALQGTGMGELVPKGEKPPPTALVGRWRKGDTSEDAGKGKKGKSWGLAMWSGWGSSHDEHTLQRTEKLGRARSSSGAGSEKKGRPSVGGIGSGGEAPRSSSSRTRGMETVPTAPSSRLRMESGGGNNIVSAAPRQEEPSATVDASQNEERGLPDIVSAETTSMSPPLPTTAAAAAVVAGTATVAAAVAATTAATQTERIQQRPMSTSISSPIPVENGALPNTTNLNHAASPQAPVSAIPLALRTQNLQQRPLSASSNSPIPVENEARHRRQVSLNAREAPIAVDAVGSGEPQEDSPANGENDLVDRSLETPGMSQSNGVAAAAANASIQTARQAPLASNPPHIELMGDSPAPVELPSTSERSPPPPTNSTNILNPTTSTPNVGLTDNDILVSPIETPTQNHVWTSTTQKQSFNQRTSMLGSIGADGMPNAHHTFVRDDVAPRRGAPQSALAEENGNARRESWEGVDDDEDSQAPQNAVEPLKLPGAKQANRESGVLGMQLADLNLVGEQRDRPPSPPSDAPVASNDNAAPAMDVSAPETPAKIPPPIPKTSPSSDDDEETDTPPPPPPKDEKHIPSPAKSKGKITGLRKPIQRLNSVESLPGSNVGLSAGAGNKVAGGGNGSTSAAPVIGDLFFERPTVDSGM